MNKKLILVLSFALVCWALFFTNTAKSEDKLTGFGGIFFDALDGKVPKKELLLDKSEGLWDPIYTDQFYHWFRWDWHVELCASNRALDVINGEGSFDKRLKASVEAGGMPCPSGPPNDPSWSYDWKGHIDKHWRKV
jgi:hypothetical protein